MSPFIYYLNAQSCCEFQKGWCFVGKSRAGVSGILNPVYMGSNSQIISKAYAFRFQAVHVCKPDRQSLNTTVGLLTQTLCFPQLVIESPHCLIEIEWLHNQIWNIFWSWWEHQHFPFKIKIISLTVLSEDWCCVEYQEMREPWQDCLKTGQLGTASVLLRACTHGLLSPQSIKAKVGLVCTLLKS